jgi:hypothetical protein
MKSITTLPPNTQRLSCHLAFHKFGGLMAGCLVLVILVTTSASAQNTSADKAKSTAKTYAPARTPWGDPDLSGVYTNSDDAFVAWAPSDFIAGCRGFLLERGRRAGAGTKVEPVENRVGFSKDKPKSGDHRPSSEWPFQRFNWTDHAADVVVNCTGSATGLPTALTLVRPRGTIVLKTTVAGTQQMPWAPIVIDEVTIVGSRCGPFDRALEALEAGSVSVLPMISERFDLSDGVAALEAAKRPGVLKVLIDVGRAGVGD